MKDKEINFIVQGILQNSNAGKQRLGQRIAFHLGLKPGPKGSDDGIDGLIIKGNKIIHFQSKLRSVKLDKDDARACFSDILYHKANVSIILSGVGFKSTFEERLFSRDMLSGVDIYLLELKDLIEQNDKFKQACLVLPELRSLDNEIKKILE